jgi:hypothetical protein
LSEAALGMPLNSEEMEKEAMVKKCFFRPNSQFRQVWDLVQVVLLLYLLVSVPLRIGFDMDVEFGTFGYFWDMFVDIFFLVDIWVNFRTAYYNKHGYLEIRLPSIARNYARSWLSLDVITCLPVPYAIMLIRWDTNASGSGSQMKAFKVLRLLKLGKLLRVTRETGVSILESVHID